MNIEQTPRAQAVMGGVRWNVRIGWFGLTFRVVTIWAALVLLGGSALPADMTRTRRMAMAVAGWGFDLVEWEVDALARKATASIQRPAAGLDVEAGAALVRAYMADAARVGELEGRIRRLRSEGGDAAQGQAELTALRVRQEDLRPAVEQVIERQVGSVLREAGFGVGPWLAPPLQFAFTDPPKTLVVSPRDEIMTVYSRMVDGAIPLGQIEQSEAAIDKLPNASAYITEIGGLGAYPTMVIDQASLPWVLSTVAHEWVHNYLTFFPLGWSYFSSQDMKTINETVANIVGDEIGARTLRRYYPELIWSEVGGRESGAQRALKLPKTLEMAEEEFIFDFGKEMRLTRLEVDRLLAQGKVGEAERYMEMRRQVFVKAGYPLRVLNQAYFAFHGSYGTSAASSSPIGPKLEELHSRVEDIAQLHGQMQDIGQFLRLVRWFTSVDDLDDALARWAIDSPSLTAP
ncbi:MAG: hypothetical protein IT329_06420 [Caldilineaceae bacterium]|nr:hypothetical protein [Caldilineaceae bacterium]